MIKKVVPIDIKTIDQLNQHDSRTYGYFLMRSLE